MIRRLPRTTSLRRFAKIPSRCAASACRSPAGLRNSSSRISPGGKPGRVQFGALVMVFDMDLVGMAVLRPKRHAIRIVDPNAVLCESRPLEALQSTAFRDSEVVESSRQVQGLEFAVRDRPQSSRQAASVARVAFAEKVDSSFIGEQLYHVSDELHDTRVSM